MNKSSPDKNHYTNMDAVKEVFARGKKDAAPRSISKIDRNSIKDRNKKTGMVILKNGVKIDKEGRHHHAIGTILAATGLALAAGDSISGGLRNKNNKEVLAEQEKQQKAADLAQKQVTSDENNINLNNALASKGATLSDASGKMNFDRQRQLSIANQRRESQFGPPAEPMKTGGCVWGRMKSKRKSKRKHLAGGGPAGYEDPFDRDYNGQPMDPNQYGPNAYDMAYPPSGNSDDPYTQYNLANAQNNIPGVSGLQELGYNNNNGMGVSNALSNAVSAMTLSQIGKSGSNNSSTAAAPETPEAAPKELSGVMDSTVSRNRFGEPMKPNGKSYSADDMNMNRRIQENQDGSVDPGSAAQQQRLMKRRSSVSNDSLKFDSSRSAPKPSAVAPVQSIAEPIGRSPSLAQPAQPLIDHGYDADAFNKYDKLVSDGRVNPSLGGFIEAGKDQLLGKGLDKVNGYYSGANNFVNATKNSLKSAAEGVGKYSRKIGDHLGLTTPKPVSNDIELSDMGAVRDMPKTDPRLVQPSIGGAYLDEARKSGPPSRQDIANFKNNNPGLKVPGLNKQPSRSILKPGHSGINGDDDFADSDINDLKKNPQVQPRVTPMGENSFSKARSSLDMTRFKKQSNAAMQQQQQHKPQLNIQNGTENASSLPGAVGNKKPVLNPSPIRDAAHGQMLSQRTGLSNQQAQRNIEMQAMNAGKVSNKEPQGQQPQQNLKKAPQQQYKSPSAASGEASRYGAIQGGVDELGNNFATGEMKKDKLANSESLTTHNRVMDQFGQGAKQSRSKPMSHYEKLAAKPAPAASKKSPVRQNVQMQPQMQIQKQKAPKIRRGKKTGGSLTDWNRFRPA